MKHIHTLSFLFLATLFFGYHSVLAQAGFIDPTFNPSDFGFGKGDGAMGVNTSHDTWIDATAIQSDGKILIGGKFTSYDGIPTHNLARLNIDGSLDTSFKATAGVWTVEEIAIQDDGKIIIAGDFWAYKNIIRINTDGSIDSSFYADETANDEVKTIKIQKDGKILIGGLFYNKIARLNKDGSRDLSFSNRTPTIGNSKYHSVQAIEIDSDGSILVGGWFSTREGASNNNITRLNKDGMFEYNFDSDLSTNGIINTIAIQNDGKILIGGVFNSYNGVGRNGIARLSEFGTLDPSFKPEIAMSYDLEGVNSIAIQSNGKIIVAGDDFYGYRKQSIIRFNNNGSVDKSFEFGTNANSTVKHISIRGDGKIIIGGLFTTYNGAERNRVALLNTNGSLYENFAIASGASGSIYTIAIQKDSKILISGWFRRFNNFTRNHIARLNSDGSLDESFNPSTTEADFVNKMALQDDGKVLIVRQTITSALQKEPETVRLNANGSIDSSYIGAKFSAVSLNSIAIQSDGKYLIGGRFYPHSRSTTRNIVRLNSNGSIDVTFTSPLNSDQTISVLAPQTDGKTVIAGNFQIYTYTGWDRVGIARLNNDGTFDRSFSTQASGVIEVNAIVIQPDSKILLGGGFSACNGIGRRRVARLNRDGSLDMSFDPGAGANGEIKSIALEKDGKIIIVGAFTSYNNTERNGIAKLNIDGSLDLDFNPGIGVDYLPLNKLTRQITTVAIPSEGKILIGGHFISYDGIGRNRIARILNSSKITTNDAAFPEKNIFIFPNPSNGIITINSPQSEGKAEVYTNRGCKVYSTAISEKTTELNLQSLDRGIYVIKLYHAEGFSVGKLFIE